MKQTHPFAHKLLAWFDKHGRKNLPWQQSITPYRVWLSEIMLQQTQVETVIPYFNRFLERFPNLLDLAKAPQDDVLHLWTGLGYYARARNLHKCAQTIWENYNGEFPNTVEELASLPGIGPSTAAAIASIAFEQPTAILDGNVKRVLARHHAVEGWPGQKPVENTLWQHAHSHMPQKRCRDYTQAIMDLGATLCTRSKPQCHACPVAKSCQAYTQGNPLDYPGKKPKKLMPVKAVNMLMLRSPTGDIFLQQRPQQGIWGGLWSLPEIEPEQSPLEHTLATYGEVTQHQQIAQLRHTFSHYHLDISAHLLDLKRAPTQVMEQSDCVWYKLHTPQALGLAAPVKKLLQLVKQHHSETP